MSFADERTAIEGRMEVSWALAPDAAVKVAYENVKFKPVEGVEYIAFFIVPGEGRQISLGDAPVHRFVGLIQASIYVPERKGGNRARILADQVADIFRNAQFSSSNSGLIRTRTPSMMTFGTDGGWFRVDVNVSYFRDINFVSGGPITGGSPVIYTAMPMGETPGGIINGVNTIFTLVSSPAANRLLLFQNGGLLTQGIDYTLVGNTITFFVAPDVGPPVDVLRAYY